MPPQRDRAVVRAGAASLAVEQTVGQRCREAGLLDGASRLLDRVLHAVPRGRPALEVEQEPRGARIAVARLTHAARVQYPVALREVHGGAAVRLLAAGRAVVAAL